VAEGVVGTMATVALFALMMDASDPDHAGTDFTLLASVVVGGGQPWGVSPVAWWATRWGYVWAFGIGTVLSALGLCRAW
jgi:PAT family beta-lactamase induction signal transducer AmpG